MSCTVVAVPLALSHIIGIIAASAATSAAAAAAANAGAKEMAKYAQEYANRYQEEVKRIQDYHIIEEEYQTAYMDKDILIKTLEEHGIVDIEENYDNSISGSVESFNLTFSRASENEPYVLKISCKDTDNAGNKIEDLNNEYALNVQEDAYLNLLEKLKANNMEIENEVVEDDNTIVLTINLE